MHEVSWGRLLSIQMQQRALNFKHDGYGQQAIAEKLSVSRWTIRKLLGKPQRDGFKRYYFHYSIEPFVFDKFKPVDDKVYCGKPRGLWLSVETVHDRGWWGYLEEFIRPSTMYRTRFGVNPGRLLTVSSPWDDDVEGLAVANLPRNKLHDEWDKIRQQWDGIVIPDWEKRLDLPSQVPGGNEILHSSDYDWWALLDASSACIWNYRNDATWQIGESIRYEIGVDEHFIPLHESAEYRITPKRESRINALVAQELGY